MGGQKGKTRGEVEVKRLTKDPVVLALFNRSKIKLLEYLDVMKIETPVDFRRWVTSLKEISGVGFFRKSKKILVEEFSLLEFLDKLERIVSMGNQNPHTDMELKVLEKLLFGEAVFERYQGISYEFKDNEEEGDQYYQWALIKIEPGAKKEDLNKFVRRFGKHITSKLEEVLPESSHLRGNVSQQWEDTIKMAGIIKEMKTKGFKFMKICDELEKQGYKRIKESYARNIYHRTKM